MTDLWDATTDLLADVRANGNGAAPDYSEFEASPGVDPTVTLHEFVALKPDADTDPLIACQQGPVIHAGALCLLGGKTSSGKTTWLLDLLLHAAAGVDYCGLMFPRPLRVLLIENEVPREGFRQKLEQRLRHGPSTGEPIRIWDDARRWGAVRVSDGETREQLRAVTETHRIDIVVSDTMTRFGMKGNGTPEETRDFMVLLADAGLGRTVAFLILLHTRTRVDPAEDELEQIAGAWAPHADALLMVKKLDGNRARLSYPKTRYARGHVPSQILAFDPETEGFTAVATDDDQPEKVNAETYDERVLQWLADHPWTTTEELDAGVAGRAAEVREARKRLKASGRVSATPSAQLGRPGKGLRWNLAPTDEYNPVPLPGTGQDGEASRPVQEGNPVPGVPHLKGGHGGDGVPGQGTETGALGVPLRARALEDELADADFGGEFE